MIGQFIMDQELRFLNRIMIGSTYQSGVLALLLMLFLIGISVAINVGSDCKNFNACHHRIAVDLRSIISQST